MTERTTTMRRPIVLIDVNILISYLLNAGRGQSALIRATEWILAGGCKLIMTELLLQELVRVVTKPKLSHRISSVQIAEFLDKLSENSELQRDHPVELATSSRDENDDYLLQAAIVADVDFLITGDKDLLSLRGKLERPVILTAAAFVGAMIGDDTALAED